MSIFEIVFQEGSSIPKEYSFLGISVDTIFTVCVTIFIFFVGQLFKKWYDDNKEKERLKRINEFFKELVFSTQEDLLDLTSNISEFSEKLNEESETHLSFKYKKIYQLDILRRINYKDLFSIYLFDKAKIKSGEQVKLSRMLSKIEYLCEANSSLTRHHNEMKFLLKEYKAKYNACYIDSHNVFFQYLAQFPKDDKFINELYLIRCDWTKEPNSHELKVTFDKYLSPTLKLCYNYMKKDSRAANLHKYIYECVNSYENLTEVKKVYSKIFSDLAHEMNNSYNELFRNTNKLNY